MANLEELRSLRATLNTVLYADEDTALGKVDELKAAFAGNVKTDENALESAPVDTPVETPVTDQDEREGTLAEEKSVSTKKK